MQAVPVILPATSPEMSYQKDRDEELGVKQRNGVSHNSADDGGDSVKEQPPTALDTYFADNRVEVPPGDEVRSGDWTGGGGGGLGGGGGRA